MRCRRGDPSADRIAIAPVRRATGGDDAVEADAGARARGGADLERLDPPILVGSTLYARDRHRTLALDLGDANAPAPGPR